MKTKEAKQLIQEFLERAGFTIDSIQIEEKAEKEYYINISTEKDAVSLIGQKGIVLSAIQHLIKIIFRKQDIIEEGDHLKLDVDSYRNRQEENVLKMAEKRASDVMENGGRAVLPPMSPFFRRLVHLHIKDNFPELNTMSKGMGNDRAVCITSENQAPDVEAEVADLYNEVEF